MYDQQCHVAHEYLPAAPTAKPQGPEIPFYLGRSSPICGNLYLKTGNKPVVIKDADNHIILRRNRIMALTFKQMVAQARENVPGVSSVEAREKINANPNTFVVDVQDAADSGACGLIPSSANITLGMLAIRADLELPESFRDSRLADRSRPVLVTCGAGGQAALGAYLLKQMGFTDVAYIDGGTAAWKAAGFEVE
jgi:rhodanese-related sulfurtransferase